MLPDSCAAIPPGDVSIEPIDAPAPTVSSLLTLSRAAHLQKKHHAGRTNKQGQVSSPPNYPQAEAAIREAITAREQAHQLDPDQTDPAWIEDQSLNKGMTSLALLAMFRDYLLIP